MQYLLGGTLLQRKLQQSRNFVDETLTWQSKQATCRTSRQGSEVLVAKPSQATPTLLLFLLFLTTRHVSLSLSLLFRHRTIFLSIPTCI